MVRPLKATRPATSTDLANFKMAQCGKLAHWHIAQLQTLSGNALQRKENFMQLPPKLLLWPKLRKAQAGPVPRYAWIVVVAAS